MLAHAMVTHTEYTPFPQMEPSKWKVRLFGTLPWCKSFDKKVPQQPNAEVPVKTFVLKADLPEEAEEDCLYPGDRMRFTHSVLDETELDDHVLSVLAVEEFRPTFRVYPIDRTASIEKADSYSKTIAAFRWGKKGIVGPAKRVLIRDTVDGSFYSVSPKLLRKDR